MALLNKKTTNSYKAAYLMTQGAALVDISIRPAQHPGIMTNKVWVIELGKIPIKAWDSWESGQAFCNILDFERERLRIKKLAKQKKL